MIPNSVASTKIIAIQPNISGWTHVVVAAEAAAAAVVEVVVVIMIVVGATTAT